MAESLVLKRTVASRPFSISSVVRRLPWLYFMAGFTLLFLYLPVVMVMVFSFSTDYTTRFPIRSLTLNWFAMVLANEELLNAARNSLIVAVGTALIAALIGTPAALALTRYRFHAQGTLSAIITMPMTLPTLIVGVALLILFSTAGFKLSLLTVVIGHTVYLLPYTFLIIKARLQDMDRFIEEAARDLGANGWRTFWEITFPLIRSSILGASFLVFSQSFDMFVISFFTIGNQNTLPMVIWSMLRTGVNPSINALSFLMITISALMLVTASRFTRITIEI